VSASTASRQNCSHAVNINHRLEWNRESTPPSAYSACFETFNNTPTLASAKNSDDPP
jgi:hypothetical protein